MAHLRKGKSPFLPFFRAGAPGLWASLPAWQRMSSASLSSISRVLRFARSALSAKACADSLH